MIVRLPRSAAAALSLVLCLVAPLSRAADAPAAASAPDAAPVPAAAPASAAVVAPAAAPASAPAADAAPLPADVEVVPTTPVGLTPPPQPAPQPKTEAVKITDPFIEMHTGPGRGYPVFHVAGRGEWIEILLRHTDWFKVRAADGKVGWVNRHQLETTLTDAGGTKTFRDALLDDYLARRVEFGMGYGRFHGDPMIKIWTGWRFTDTLSVEATYGQVQGTFSGTDLWHVDLHVEPWSDQRLSPFLGIGFGHFTNIPNLSLVDDATTNAKMGDASVGARWHLGERFVLRADYTLYTALLSDQKTTQYHAATLGLSFFF
jgi:hypothetical protein